MAEAFPMNGGDGDYSYTKNSQFQKQGFDTVKGMIEEAVMKKLKLSSTSSRVAIADLGCSVGPNTIISVQNLIQAVEKKLILQGVDPKDVEFHVFFNDVTANDFNTLFASLPDPAERQYYVAGAPGSFYGRLFPRGSISVAYSAYALQLLSRQPQPQGVPNEGRIHCGGAPPEVLRAYSDQFEKDLQVFISARAVEMVRGGLLFLIMPGLPDGVSPSQRPHDFLFSFFGNSLMELANEGVVDKAKVDAFNLPIYVPTVGEMREVIEKNGCFSIEIMELTNPRSGVEALDAASIIMHLRAGTEGIFTAYFGTCVVDKMFADVSAKAQEAPLLVEAAVSTSSQLLFVLKRK